jgi:hypothetical protein
MLAHPLFSQSKRYAPFLRYIVEKTLAGEESALKERIIGMEVLGRAPDYDNNNDPVVRVTAGEVRRRLAQYYQDPKHEGELRISVFPGSYVPGFSFFQEDVEARYATRTELLARVSLQSKPEPDTNDAIGAASEADERTSVAGPLRTSTPASSAFTGEADRIFGAQLSPQARLDQKSGGRSRLSFWGACGAILLLLVLAASWYQLRSDRWMKAVWGNLLEGDKPVLISAGEPNLYPLQSDAVVAKPISGQDHVRGDVLSYSEVQALVTLVTFLDRHEGSSLQSAAQTTFSDLRLGPTVLLGGLNNPWTLRAQQTLRYQMATDGKGLDWIVDRNDPGNRRWVIDVSQQYAVLKNDYAVVARFTDPSTQKPTLIVAGLGENGTKAASEFITDPETLRHLGQDWLGAARGKNFEVVLQTQLINGAYGPPRVLAKEVW